MPKNILILGAGLISPPFVQYLLSATEHNLVVGAAHFGVVERLLDGEPRARHVSIDVTDSGVVASLMDDADIVVSLLPAPLNPSIAKLAVSRGLSLVNTSYEAPATRELDHAAQAAGVTLLSEMGLDPGFDHMTAVDTIHRLRASGAVITRFESSCGGLPAPDSNDNPWGYKLSWSPRAFLLAGRNAARYLRGGHIVEVAPEDLFGSSFHAHIDGIGALELFPNRDALIYRDLYDLSDVEGMFRGTFRYPGFCETMHAVVKLGLLSLDEGEGPDAGTYLDLTTRLVPKGGSSVAERIAGFLGIGPDSDVIARLEWAGLLSDRPLPLGSASPLDRLAARLSKRMAYKAGECDMVALQHRFTATFPDGSIETVTSELIELGAPFGDTAMARSVALPAAIATRMILEGEIDLPGAHVPIRPEIYAPVLAELEELGIAMRERRTRSFPGPLG